MPSIVRIPIGVGRYGKPRYKKMIKCEGAKDCPFTDASVDVVREHERKHREAP